VVPHKVSGAQNCRHVDEKGLYFPLPERTPPFAPGQLQCPRWFLSRTHRGSAAPRGRQKGHKQSAFVNDRGAGPSVCRPGESSYTLMRTILCDFPFSRTRSIRTFRPRLCGVLAARERWSCVGLTGRLSVQFREMDLSRIGRKTAKRYGYCKITDKSGGTVIRCELFQIGTLSTVSTGSISDL
jgi:hypothetical protein